MENTIGQETADQPMLNNINQGELSTSALTKNFIHKSSKSAENIQILDKPFFNDLIQDNPSLYYSEKYNHLKQIE